MPHLVGAVGSLIVPPFPVIELLGKQGACFCFEGATASTKFAEARNNKTNISAVNFSADCVGARVPRRYAKGTHFVSFWGSALLEGGHDLSDLPRLGD